MKSWNSLSPIEKIDSLTKVLTRAGSDRRFREKLLKSSLAKAAIQAEAGATFDESMTIRVLPNQAVAEKEIVLLLPELIEGADLPRKADDYWLCSYTPYVDTVPPRDRNISGDIPLDSARTRQTETEANRHNTLRTVSNPPTPASAVTSNRRSWNALNPAEKIDSLTNVLTRAGSDPQFRKLCLNSSAARAAIQEEAAVIFDDDIIIRVLANQESAEKEIVLLLPQLIEDAEIPRKADDYWLCTYWPYADESTRTIVSARGEASVR